MPYKRDLYTYIYALQKRPIYIYIYALQKRPIYVTWRTRVSRESSVCVCGPEKMHTRHIYIYIYIYISIYIYLYMPYKRDLYTRDMYDTRVT